MALFEKDGFVIDLNRLTRRAYAQWRAARQDADDKDMYDAEHLIAKIVVMWPYEQPITVDGYMALGLEDSLAVDTIVGEAVDTLTQKKSD